MKTVNIGVIGMGWMGTVHSRSYVAIKDKFFDKGINPRLVICADNVETRGAEAQRRFGFEEATTDWMAVINHPEVAILGVHRMEAGTSPRDWSQRPVSVAMRRPAEVSSGSDSPLRRSPWRMKAMGMSSPPGG